MLSAKKVGPTDIYVKYWYGPLICAKINCNFMSPEGPYGHLHKLPSSVLL